MAAYPPEFLIRNQPPLDRQATTTRCVGFHAIVTGGASGIGRAMVERLLNDGASRVAIFDLDEKLADDAIKDLQSTGVDAARICRYVVDVSDDAQVQTCVSHFATEHCAGKLDILIHCAAKFTSLSVTATDDDFLSSYKVNVLGAVHCVRAARPFLKKAAGESSAVLLLSSTAAFVAQKQRWTYAATKGATTTLVRDMAADLSYDNIRVNAIIPGYVWSPVEKMVSKDGSREAMSFLTKPAAILGRDSLVSEMAAVGVFLCCKDASAVTGTSVQADGGYLSMGPEGKEPLVFK